jgi:hypothetical protein
VTFQVVAWRASFDRNIREPEKGEQPHIAEFSDELLNKVSCAFDEKEE